jgi:hypothetical protein
MYLALISPPQFLQGFPMEARTLHGLTSPAPELSDLGVFIC